MVVLEGNKRLRTVLVETQYGGQSQQEVKIVGQVYTL